MKCPGCNAEIDQGMVMCPTCGTATPKTLSQKVRDKIEQIVPDEGMGPVQVQLGFIQSIYAIISLAILTVIFVAIFAFAVYNGVPIIIAVFFLGVLALMWAGVLYQRKRLKGIDLSNPEGYYKQEYARKYGSTTLKSAPEMSVFGEGNVKLNPGESVIGYASPVYRLQSTSTGIGMVSVEKYTENSIILTDRRIVFLTVPLEGQGLMINGQSTDAWNDITKRKKIKEFTKKSIAKMESIEGVNHYPNDFWIDRNEIKQVGYLKTIGPIKTLYGGAVKFYLSSGKKFKYTIIDPEDVDFVASNMNAVKKHAL
ncbi:MAG: hypothetical protein ACYCR7_05455 [Thermoplasmataceae archaeon]